MNIAVCDNDAEVAKELKTLIVEQHEAAKVEIFLSAAEILRREDDFDIYFLDIKGISGLDLANKIRKRQEKSNQRSIIVFVTGYVEHMAEAFDVQAFHYLLKPIKKEKFCEVLNKAWDEAKRFNKPENRHIMLKLPHREKKVLLKDIIYAESNNKKVTLHTTKGVYDVLGKMEDFESILPKDSFYRSHRCYLVNLAKITAYGQNEIELVNGERILLAYKRYTAFVKAYLVYAKEGGAVNVR